MNAKQARKLTEDSLSAEAIRPFVDHVLARVARAAKEGRYEVSISGFGNLRPTGEQVRCVWTYMVSLGYKVEVESGGHQLDSYSDTLISWGG